MFYLNDAQVGGDAGGELRLHDVPRRPKGDPGPESYMDVQPDLGTLVVFRRYGG